MPKEVIARYKCSSGWTIPDDIVFIEDGGDGKKVGSWYVRWDKLHILQEKDGKKVWRVVKKSWSASGDFDFKRPDETDAYEVDECDVEVKEEPFEEDEDSEVEEEPEEAKCCWCNSRGCDGTTSDGRPVHLECE